ncbi:MAG: response regulator [Lachnospiraceae bacterium]
MNTEKILLVDDERAIRLAVRTALTREGMQVTEAADGSEALELLKKQQFHLVILDVMMEHVGGYDVLQAMRAAGDHTPVMMLSGKSDEMDQVLGLGLWRGQLSDKAVSYCDPDPDSKGTDPQKSDLQPGSIRRRRDPQGPVYGRYLKDGVPEKR